MTDVTHSLRPVRSLGDRPENMDAIANSPPEFAWVHIDNLYVNESYQRELSQRSLRQIRKIAQFWDWAKVKSLSLAPSEAGGYEIIDGQHTAIAAATRGDIPALPCLIQYGLSRADKAESFVGINTQKLQVTPQQVFWARVAAGDDDAIDLRDVVDASGGRILRYPPAQGRFQVGDIMALKALEVVFNHGGKAWVRRVVEICVAANMAPIRELFFPTLATLLWTGERAGRISDERLINVIRLHTQEGLIGDAQTLRSRQKMSPREALLTVIERLA